MPQLTSRLNWRHRIRRWLQGSRVDLRPTLQHRVKLRPQAPCRRNIRKLLMRTGQRGLVLSAIGVIVLLPRSASTYVSEPTVAQLQYTSSQDPAAERPKAQTGRAASLPTNAEPFEIHGVVITARSKPVAGAEVRINLQGTERKVLPPHMVETDIHGEFRVKLPPPGQSSRSFEIALAASKDGFLDAHDWIEAAAEGGQNPVELALQKP